jgi:dTDP-4-amino-4,6-dideoxygalactose transaminase
MQVGFYGHVRQYRNIQAEIDANIRRVLESGEYVQGPMLKQFEQELAAFHGMTHAVGTGNGTDCDLAGPDGDGHRSGRRGRHASEHLLCDGRSHLDCRRDRGVRGLRSADEVPRSGEDRGGDHAEDQGHHSRASVRAVRRHAGDQEDCGQAHGLRVIEDNAQAIDAAGDGFRIGELSDANTTSFITQKNLGTFGDGGALLTNDAEIDARVRKLRNHGSNKRNVHSFGFNSRLDDLHAGVLSAKLKHIHAWNDQRIGWAARYSEGLRGATHMELPYVKPGYRHVFHLYVIETKDPADRDPLLDFLVKNGVDAKTHYSIAIHQQEGYPWGKGARIAGSVAHAERNAACCISLPMYPELTAAEVDYVVARVLEWDRAAR